MRRLPKATMAVVATLAMCIAGPAVARDFSGTEPSSTTDSHASETLPSGDALAYPRISAEDAFKQDAAQLAKMNGVGQAEAEVALVAGEKLKPLTGRIRNLIGDREVSIVKEYTPVTKLRVEISGEDEVPGLDELVASSPSPIEVSYVDKPSVTALHEALSAAKARWRDSYPQIVRTTVDDSDPNQVLAFFTPGRKVTEYDLRKAAPAFPTNVKISVQEETPDNTGGDLSRGNLRLN